MKKYNFNNIDFELIYDYRDAFNKADIKEKLTDYFDGYDYIIGDWSYGKIRLKGFCDKGNPNYNKINDYKNKDEYIKKNCAYQCRYFILRKIKNEV